MVGERKGGELEEFGCRPGGRKKGGGFCQLGKRNLTGIPAGDAKEASIYLRKRERGKRKRVVHQGL